MKTKPLVLVGISDTHVGSEVALMPRNYETRAGNKVHPNQLQAWIEGRWALMVKEVFKRVGKDEFILVVNGDIIEGNHHGGRQLSLSDLADQIDAAKQLFKPLVERATRVYLTAGTECHTREIETDLANAFGAERTSETGRKVPNRWDLRMGGGLVAVRHHFPSTTRSHLEASQYSIQMTQEKEAAVNAGLPVPTVLMGAHRHRYGSWQTADSLVVVTPPWQGLTRFGGKVVPQEREITVGAVVLDWRGNPKAPLPAAEGLIYQRVTANIRNA